MIIKETSLESIADGSVIIQPSVDFQQNPIAQSAIAGFKLI
jgi:hypothetical protein